MATIEHTIRIHAPADAVFAALSTDDGVRAWFTPDIEGSMAAGQTVAAHFSDGETLKLRIDDVQPNRTIRWTCTDGPGSAAGSSVTFELRPDGRDTRVNLAHAGWPENSQAFATCNTHWGILLGRLKNDVENHAVAGVFP